MVLGPLGELTGQVTGKLLHNTRSAADFPKVGDWVAFTPLLEEGKAIIHEVLPRRTKLSRKLSGRDMGEQVLATNIDIAFVVQALDRTFNPGLLHRHLVMVFESGAKPVAVLNKADLCPEITERLGEAQTAAGDAPVVAVSAKTGEGLERLGSFIHKGETVVFIGASGVGKSTLINDLFGEDIQATTEVREADAKGRHTTTWRELILLPNGGLVIDTPGMREFHIWIANEGMREAFADLDALAANCRFRDCSHTVEKECALLGAVAAAQIPAERFQGYLKLRRELAYLQSAQTKQSWVQRKRTARIAQRVFNKQKRRP